MSNPHIVTGIKELTLGVEEVLAENEELKLHIASLGFPQRVILGADGSYERLRGPKRPNRKKLSATEVKDIRQAYRGGMKQSDLAKNYGVNPATISRTVRGIYH